MNRSLIISLLLSATLIATIQAQERRTEVRVIFPVDVIRLNPAFGDNAERLDRIISSIDSSLNKNSRIRLVNVVFSGWASPEGGVKHNYWLAEKRRDALADYVRSHINLPDSLLTFSYSAVNWDGLVQKVEADTLMSDRDEVLDIIACEPETITGSNGGVTASRISRLMRLRGGKTWRYMLTRHFPDLRNASAVILAYHEEAKPEQESVTPDTPLVERRLKEPDLRPPVTSLAPLSERPNRYWSLHTNMLYDLLAVPNLGAEFYLGRRFSVTGNWMYGWWKSDRVHRYWRIYGGGITVRRWFGSLAKEKPLTGHHLGLYGQVLTYDFEFGGKGWIGGVPGCNIFNHPSLAFGAEYGFALPIARRLNIDFSIGYLSGRYYEYRPQDNHYVWSATKQRKWFGPTKIEASLVWLFGHGNFNKKGGEK